MAKESQYRKYIKQINYMLEQGFTNIQIANTLKMVFGVGNGNYDSLAKFIRRNSDYFGNDKPMQAIPIEGRTIDGQINGQINHQPQLSGLPEVIEFSELEKKYVIFIYDCLQDERRTAKNADFIGNAMKKLLEMRMIAKELEETVSDEAMQVFIEDFKKLGESVKQTWERNNQDGND